MRFHQDIRGIEFRLDVRANGTKGVEAFGARELHFAFLEVARGDVVQATIAKQIAQRIVGVFQLRTAPANDKRKLTFVFDALRLGRQNNRLAGADDRRRWLKKNERLPGHFIAKFFGVRRIITPDAHNFSGIDGSQQTYVSNRPEARPAGPGTPRGTGNVANVMAFEQAVKRRGRLRRGSTKWKEAAEFHSGSARMVIRMRHVRRANAPDDGPNPREGNHEHIQYRTKHEDLNGAKTLRKARKTHAKNTVGQAEKRPRDEARSQQMTRHAPKSENGNHCDETQNSHRGQIPHQRKAIEHGNTIGDDHPSAKNDGKNDPDV